MSSLFIDAVSGFTQGVQEAGATIQKGQEQQVAAAWKNRELAMKQELQDEKLAGLRQARSIKDLTLSEMQKDISLKDKKRSLISGELDLKSKISNIKNQYRVSDRAANVIYQQRDAFTDEGLQLFTDWAKEFDAGSSFFGGAQGGAKRGSKPSDIEYTDVVKLAKDDTALAESVQGARKTLNILQAELEVEDPASPTASRLRAKVADQQELIQVLESNHGKVRSIFQAVSSGDMNPSVAASESEAFRLSAESFNAAARAKREKQEAKNRALEEELSGGLDPVVEPIPEPLETPEFQGLQELSPSDVNRVAGDVILDVAKKLNVKPTPEALELLKQTGTEFMTMEMLREKAEEILLKTQPKEREARSLFQDRAPLDVEVIGSGTIMR